MSKSYTYLLVVLTVMASEALAQTTRTDVNKPLSNTGGYTGTQLKTIYRQDVGEGYSGDSLNSIALRNAQARVGNVGQSSAGSPQPGIGLSTSLAPSRSAKPFSNVSSSPTVSPYLNLFREDFDGSSDFNYQTLVRPQLQQEQFNQQFQRQNSELAARVQAISAQSPYKNPAGSEVQYPTGHTTAFGFYGSYYPGMAQQPRGR